MMSKRRGDPLWVRVLDKLSGHERHLCESEYDPSDDCPVHPGRCCADCDRQPRCRLRIRCGATGKNSDCYPEVKKDVDGERGLI
jgi:hypothetical protein